MLGLTIQDMESASPVDSPLWKEPSMQQVFEVQGMTCGHCERAVTNAIQGVDAQAQIRSTAPPTEWKSKPAPAARPWQPPLPKRAAR